LQRKNSISKNSRSVEIGKIIDTQLTHSVENQNGNWQYRLHLFQKNIPESDVMGLENFNLEGA
jgi:hypothetical protein